MKERIADFSKTARSMTTTAKSLDALAKAMAGDTTAVTKLELAEKAHKGLADLPEIDETIRTLAGDANRLVGDLTRIVEKERALLAGKVANALREQGITVSGNLPQLTAGVLSLEFRFGPKGQCTLWFGPKKARLATSPLEADIIAQTARQILDGLFPQNFDEEHFLARLEKAVKIAAVRLGAGESDRVPLVAVMTEMAFLAQREGFLNDPRKESFISYGRVEFATDLSRLKGRRRGNREVRFDVATMAQTRNEHDSLWIPRGKTGDGVHLATVRFVPVAD